MKYAQVVAIDGPSGSGKSSLTKLLAKSLGLLYIDTGAMYRAIGLFLHEHNVNLESREEVLKVLSRLNLEYGKSPDNLISINGVNRTEDIREHSVSALASDSSKVAEIRSFLVAFQQKLAGNRPCIMEGRDIGTVVFPNAFAKIFLSAKPEVRAKRRYDELKQRGETDIDLDKILEDVKDRDNKDMTRDLSPLKVAEDAVELDTSDMDIDQVIKEMKEIIEEKKKEKNIEF